MSGDVPDGWRNTRLGEVATLGGGTTPSRAEPAYWKDATIPWATPSDITGLALGVNRIVDTEAKVSERALAECSLSLNPPGTVLMTSRATIGFAAINQVPMATNQGFITFQGGEVLDADFLLYWLTAQRGNLVAAAGGSTFKELSRGTAKLLPILLPPLDEQRRIAEVLQSVDDAIAASVALIGAGGNADAGALLKLKKALLSDLLSGRVRVPASAPGSAATRSVPPAFKRAVFAAEIVHQLHDDSRFGSVKHEKIVHLCELHLGLQDDLDRHAYKEAAGPYDPKARRSTERILKQQKWFDASKRDGTRVVYTPLEKAGSHSVYYDRYFGNQKSAVQSIINLLRPLGTEQCEIVATLYAVWNDFLIDGHEPTDGEIVASVLNDWHPSKRQIAESRWRAALPWMREHELIPTGRGEKTRVVKQ